VRELQAGLWTLAIGKKLQKCAWGVLLDEIVFEGVSCGGSIAPQQQSVKIAVSLPMRRETDSYPQKDCLCRMDFQLRREAVASGNSDNQHNAGRHRWADSWLECTTARGIVKMPAAQSCYSQWTSASAIP
jgi:hypothetical protein